MDDQLEGKLDEKDPHKSTFLSERRLAGSSERAISAPSEAKDLTLTTTIGESRMKAKVMETIEELGFEIVATSAVYGVEDANVQAEDESRTIRTTVTDRNFYISITSHFDLSVEAIFCFSKGELPDLRFRKYTPELLELARRFGAVAGVDI